MRPFRKNSLRNKIIEYMSQILIIGFSCFFCLWMISGAKAVELNILQNIKSSGSASKSNTIEIDFKDEIASDSVKASFERNFLQFSLSNASVFPPKSIRINDKVLEKIFAYQYQPDLVRARIYISGNAEQFKDAISWTLDKNKIRIHIDSEKINVASALPTKTVNRWNDALLQQAAANDKSKSTALKSNDQNSLTKDEEQLLQSMTERLQEKKQSVTAPVAKEKETEKESDLFSGMKRESLHAEIKNSKSLGLGKVVLDLFLVLALIVAIAFIFRKFVLKRGLNFSATANSNLVTVLTNYPLAPGKAVTVVRVADDYLVLGVTGSNINLIATLDSASGIEKYLTNHKPSKSRFQKFLSQQIKSFDTMETENSNVTNQHEVSEEQEKNTDGENTAVSNIRETIKNRIKGCKQLT